MAQSTEPTGMIPMPTMDITQASDILTQGVEVIKFQRREIERLNAELASRDAQIVRLKHQHHLRRESR